MEKQLRWVVRMGSWMDSYGEHDDIHDIVVETKSPEEAIKLAQKCFPSDNIILTTLDNIKNTNAKPDIIKKYNRIYIIYKVKK